MRFVMQPVIVERQTLTLLLGLFLFSGLAANAQSDQDVKSQEDWLRYSNWEHRANAARQQTSAKTHSDEIKPDDTADRKVKLPDHPGSQTVEGGQFTIPGYAFQQPQSAQRPQAIIVGGGSSFGSTPAYDFHRLLPYSFGYTFGAPSWSYPGIGWGSGARHGWSSGWGSGWGRWGGLSYGLPGAGLYNAGFFNGLHRKSGLGGSQVIQTGPSPASGNYYQPGTGDPSASGNYYASGTPWQVPINGPNNPKDYWGPSGNPFKDAAGDR